MSQRKVGKDLPIAYATRGLTRAKINYSITEREFLAVVYLAKYFRLYLYGKKFMIVTEHEALNWLNRTQDPSRLIRWRLRLMDYKYSIQQKPGKTNKNADALSRNSVDKISEATGLLSQVQKRKPGRPPKSQAAFKLGGHISEHNEGKYGTGIADRVKEHHQGLLRPYNNEQQPYYTHVKALLLEDCCRIFLTRHTMILTPQYPPKVKRVKILDRRNAYPF